MIKFCDQVPSIYLSASRDFQYLSWLINIVLNSVKHNVDGMYDLPNTQADPRLTELLALTLGFKVKRHYDQRQLAALVSIFPSLMRYKGTKTAITMAGEALITASGAAGDFSYTIKDNLLEVILPKELVDITLFIDLLPYILPAGMTCRIIRKTQTEKVIETTVKYSDDLEANWYADTDLAGLYTSNSSQPEFTNYNDPTSNDPTLNAGLLDNTIIPMLEQAIYEDSAENEDEQ